MSNYLTPDQVAQKFGVASRTVYNWIHRGLPSHIINGKKVVMKDVVNQWVSTNAPAFRPVNLEITQPKRKVVRVPQEVLMNMVIYCQENKSEINDMTMDGLVSKLEEQFNQVVPSSTLKTLISTCGITPIIQQKGNKLDRIREVLTIMFQEVSPLMSEEAVNILKSKISNI